MKNIYIILAVIIIVIIIIAVKPKNNTDKKTNNPQDEQINIETSADVKQSSQEVQELKIEDLKVGDGQEAVSGKTIKVHYTGTLTNGSKFDSSLDRNIPFEFTLGAGQVIKGWDQGLLAMKVGGKRKLTIPPDLGYGSRAVGSIPANSTLVFEVELLEVN